MIATQNAKLCLSYLGKIEKLNAKLFALRGLTLCRFSNMIEKKIYLLGNTSVLALTANTGLITDLKVTTFKGNRELFEAINWIRDSKGCFKAPQLGLVSINSEHSGEGFFKVYKTSHS